MLMDTRSLEWIGLVSFKPLDGAEIDILYSKLLNSFLL